MAKIRVEQIKDLMLTPAPTGDENVTRSIQIGANSIVPLTSVSFKTGSAESGYISAAERKGNVIELTRVALPELSIANNETGTFVLGAEVAIDSNGKKTHQINLTKGKFDVSTNAEGETPAHTGSLIFGDDKKLKVNDTWVKSFIGDGKLQVKFVGDEDATDLFSANATGESVLTLAKVAQTGKAEDVSIADAGGIITATTVEGALQELAQKATDIEVRGKEAIKVAAVTGQTGKEVSLKLVDGEKVLSQGVAGLKTTLKVDTKKYPTESTAEGYDAQKAGKTYIQIKGINDEVISETDAAAFVKDGFLQDVKLIEASEGQENVLRFTWNSDAGVQVTDIKVSELCDVYTADETYLHLNGFKFEHKTQSLFTPVEGQPAPQTAFGDNVAADADADVTIEGAGQSAKFTVPSFVVDAAGHVTTAEDKVVEVKLPAAPTTVEKTIVTYEPKKESITPAAGTNTVTLAAEAYDYDVYLNGQLLTAGDATLGTDKKTITLSNYASMITTGDEIIVRYFVKHEDTFTVFAPATQEPAEQA